MSKGTKPGDKAAQRRSAAALRSGRRGSSPWGTAIAVTAVVLFAGLVGVGLYLSQQPTEATIPPNATAQGVVVGEPDAPVTIDLYEDFQCPACRRFEQQTGQTIDELVSAGTAKVVYHPVAYLDRFSSTEYSSRSSAASGCAAAAGVFERFADLLFANQPPEGGAGLPAEQLIALGEQAGAGDDFTACVREQRYTDWTSNLTEEASRRGINATPTVLVNGEQLGQPSPQQLRQAVAQAS